MHLKIRTEALCLPRWTQVCLLAAAVLCVIAPPARAQSPENVAVVINDNSPASVKIGDYYVRKRAIPKANIFHIRTSTDENIARPTFTASIEAPIATALARERLQDRILYLVLTKGVPLRIVGPGGPAGTMASVDSELTMLYRRMTGVPAGLPGRIENPYFLGAREVKDAKPFTHAEHDIYLVTRLDGFTVEDVIALIDKGSAPVKDGHIVLDQRDKLTDRMGDEWLEQAAKRLAAAGEAERVVLEKTIEPARDVSNVLGYYSWGSVDPRNGTRDVKMQFVPGAIGAMYVSTDARTFREPPADWTPSDSTDKATWFSGSPQSLTADLIHHGITGVAGHVSEPYLESTIRPDILFPAYIAGFNLAESFYMAMRYLSWQTVVIGDPLCAPFRRRVLKRPELESTEDAVALLPGYFAKRHAASIAAASPDVPGRAISLAMRGETLLAANDRAGAEAAYQQATQVAPRFLAPQFALALLYHQAGQLDQAIERYRRVVDIQPRHAAALNNLALLLASHKQAYDEALAVARRAVAVEPQNPLMLDTLAWIEHLTGDNANAATHIAAAVRGPVTSADIQLHAAAIYAKTGSRQQAEEHYQTAVKLNPAVENTEVAKQVRADLAKLAGQPTP